MQTDLFYEIHANIGSMNSGNGQGRIYRLTHKRLDCQSPCLDSPLTKYMELTQKYTGTKAFKGYAEMRINQYFTKGNICRLTIPSERLLHIAWI